MLYHAFKILHLYNLVCFSRSDNVDNSNKHLKFVTVK